MKLTIDSTEPLEHTLRVVGAIYDVTLEVSERRADHTRSSDDTGKPASKAAPRSRAKTRTSAKRKRAKNGRARSTANGHGQVDTGAVRAWARENGYEVADRGRVPATVLTAYRQA